MSLNSNLENIDSDVFVCEEENDFEEGHQQELQVARFSEKRPETDEDSSCCKVRG